MNPHSPGEVLGSDTPGLRDLLVEVVRARHDRAAEAHLVSESRYAMGFGSQWRDLLDDTRDALKDRGFRSCKLAPGGQEIPVVNDCLVYLWRVPNSPNAVRQFASSPTRRNSFTTAPLDPTLWEPSLVDEQESAQTKTYEGEVGPVLQAVDDSMPVVLVMVTSTPRQLRSIEWAVAVLGDDGTELRGQEAIWESEPATAGNASGDEAFDSGPPKMPQVEPRDEEGSESDD